MKRVAFVFLAFVFLFLSVSVSAHPGRTDEDGGHYDHSTGGYHWHHGYEAHQHYDMDNDGDIDCPYNFKDKTNHASGSKKTPAINQDVSNKANLFSIALVFPTVGAAIAILIFLILLFVQKGHLNFLCDLLENKFHSANWEFVPFIVMFLMFLANVMGVSLLDQNEYWGVIPFVKPLFNGLISVFIMIYTVACPFLLTYLVYARANFVFTVFLHISWIIYSFMCISLGNVVFLSEATGISGIIICCIFALVYSVYILLYTNDIFSIIINKK